MYVALIVRQTMWLGVNSEAGERSRGELFLSFSLRLSARRAPHPWLRRHGFLRSLCPLLEVLGSVLNPTPGVSCILIASLSEVSLHSLAHTVFCRGVWGQGSCRSYCPYCVAAVPSAGWHHCREIWGARVKHALILSPKGCTISAASCWRVLPQ